MHTLLQYPRRLVRLPVAAFLLCAMLILPKAAIADGLVEIEGSFHGVGSNFSGNFTHIGPFQGILNQATLTAVWTTANGDTVTNQTTSFVLTKQIGPNTFRYHQTLTITGGTGRFANATGSATATGTINVATGAYDGELEGLISRPHSV